MQNVSRLQRNGARGCSPARPRGSVCLRPAPRNPTVQHIQRIKPFANNFKPCFISHKPLSGAPSEPTRDRQCALHNSYTFAVGEGNRNVASTALKHHP